MSAIPTNGLPGSPYSNMSSRAWKLERVRRMVEDGSLTIRQATEAERREWEQSRMEREREAA